MLHSPQVVKKHSSLYVPFFAVVPIFFPHNSDSGSYKNTWCTVHAEKSEHSSLNMLVQF